LVEKLETPQPSDDQATKWFVYILRCADDSLYTGITVDVSRRIREHSGELGTNKGAKSLRGRSPLSLAYSVGAESRSQALKLEYKIKQLSKARKEKLVAGVLTLADVLGLGVR